MILDISTDFTPPLLLRHPDAQNLVSSLGLRAHLLRKRSQLLENQTKACIVDGGNGIRLSGELSVPSPDASKMAILIHGWEGSSQSAYVVSAALALFEAGFSVFRLNLRDHGDSHHLNEGLFNSTLLDEVLSAIADIQHRWPHPQTFVAGFSLGGNFALRIALHSPERQLPIDKVIAVCPVINPAQTLVALQNSRFIYENYFVRKWRKSLLKKLDHYPHYNYRKELLALKDLAGMHEFFVPRFTPYDNPNHYFSAYALSTESLSALKTPTTIINSSDDPITQAETLPDATNNENLNITVSRYGSHCAFLQDWRLTSWLDQQLIDGFSG